MKKAEIIKLNISGSVKAVASKSVAHRLLICAAFSQENSIIICDEINEDINATISCLNSLGADISVDGNRINVIPVKNASKKAVLDCSESGSTLRFMIPVVLAFGGEFEFRCRGKLASRPLKPLIDAVETCGCTVESNMTDTVFCRGKLASGSYEIPGNVSSQYITGMLFALSLLNDNSRIHLTGTVESLSYILLTIDTLRKAGIEISMLSERDYEIRGGQKYSLNSENIVEGDWSNAAFFLCAGAISEAGLNITNLNFQSIQGDRKIVDILERFGAVTEKRDSEIYIKKGNLKGIEIDASDIPDLVPVLSVVCCAAKGTSRIYNAQRLKFKESNRLEAVYENLKKLGADIILMDDGFIINGNGALNGGEVDSYNDHRIAMTCAIARIICSENVLISDCMAVKKSYPLFYEDLAKLGGIIKIMEEA